MLDEINDQTDQMEQIQQAMGQPIGAAADIDEDDLLNELEVRLSLALLPLREVLTLDVLRRSLRLLLFVECVLFCHVGVSAPAYSGS